ncbi:MAG: hypothetical protein CMJ58_22630 [Planctomycetaceae bacterium]|nr:hypothetical protein [Planctomycetaceae bacterium]
MSEIRGIPAETVGAVMRPRLAPIDSDTSAAYFTAEALSDDQRGELVDHDSVQLADGGCAVRWRVDANGVQWLRRLERGEAPE